MESFEAVKMWLPFLNELEPEVRILLCNTCEDGDGKHGPGPIFSALTLILTLRIPLPFYIGFKGKVNLKSSGEYGSRSEVR